MTGSGSLMVMVLIVELGREQRGVLVVGGSVPPSPTALPGETEGDRSGAVEAPLDAGEPVIGGVAPLSNGRIGGVTGEPELPGGLRGSSSVRAMLVVVVLVVAGAVLRPKKSDLAVLCTERRSGMFSSNRNCMSGNWMVRPVREVEVDRLS